jgi:CcmD family protein
MGNLVYLFAAYAVFWVVTFAFVFSMLRRQKHLQREVESLRKALETRLRKDAREGEE